MIYSGGIEKPKLFLPDNCPFTGHMSKGTESFPLKSILNKLNVLVIEASP